MVGASQARPIVPVPPPPVTVRVAVPEILLKVAVMVEEPAATPVARPLLLTVAVGVLDEVHVTCVVIIWVVESEYVPVAVNCWMLPAAMLAVAGVTAIEDSVAAAVTVRVAVPEILPEVALMVEVPAALAVARPLLAIVAVVVLDEVQVTCVVINWVVPSEYVPVAVNCWMVPTTLLAVAGVTAIEDRVAAVTVRVAVPWILPEVALMVTFPAALAVARPLLLIVALVVLDELQVTCVVIGWVVPSEYVPVAMNCWMVPTTLLAVAGVTAIEDNVTAAVTVRVAVPWILPEVALMVEVPVALAVARPLLLAIVAVVVLDELQVTCVVMSRVVPSEYVPEAVNCWVAPTALLAVAGVTAIEFRVVAVTVRVAVPDIPPKAAVMVVVPAATAVAMPLLLIVATPVLDEFQVTCAVISRLVPSEYVQVAVSCWVLPTTLLAVAGVIAMESSVTVVTVRVVVSVTVPLVAVMVVVPAATAVTRPLLSTVATDGLDEAQVTCVDISRLVPSE